ncbi:MAG: OadG family protein [Clostridia bacterium]|nr:OadG family protein [Clostridia bacterium]
MYTLLAITPDMYSQKLISGNVPPLEILGFGAKMMGIGMLAVFSVLCLLWGALTLFKIFFYDLPAKKKTENEAPEAPAPAAPAVAPIPAANEDEELIAVLAAAIAMAESECIGAKFRVVSFRRK